MSALLTNLREGIAQGLKIQSIRDCAGWSTQFRVMGKPFPGPYSVMHHPWAKAMLNWDGHWVGPKSSQMGYTEVALNRCFYAIDIKKTDVMYILPKADPDARDFSAARFAPALELSERLKRLFTDSNNVGHKRAGAVNLYVRGAQSRSALKSVPAGLMIFDELDEMPMANIHLAEQRTSGQLEFQIIKISTPSFPGMGIDLAYQETTKEHFYFRCPCCSRQIEMTFPESIVITADSLNDKRLADSHYICNQCKGVLHHEDKVKFINDHAEWVKTDNFDSPIRGFHVHRMYSMAQAGNPVNYAKDALKSTLDPTSEQEFHNSSRGVPHIVAGAKITEAMVNACLAQYTRESLHGVQGIRVIGIDVGTWVHYEVGEYTLTKGLTTDINVLSTYKQIDAGKVADFEELDPLMRQFQIRAAVIDANPERRKAKEFASRFPGYVYLCFYSNGLKGNDCVLNKEAGTISVDRTSWMDMSLGRFHSNRITLPINTSQEYKDHVGNVIRKYDRGPDGNPVGSYINIGPDHFAHARTYAEIALPLALTIGSNRDIKDFL